VPVQLNVDLAHKREHVRVLLVMFVVMLVLDQQAKLDLAEKLLFTPRGERMEHGVRVQQNVVEEHKPDHEVASKPILVVMIVKELLPSHELASSILL
jgi:hypothetical protein